MKSWKPDAEVKFKLLIVRYNGSVSSGWFPIVQGLSTASSGNGGDTGGGEVLC